jgi:hypothetical protein
MHASKKGYKTGLYLEYDNYEFLQTIMEQQKFKHTSTAINFIIREQRKMQEAGELEFVKKEPEQTKEDKVDIFAWLTS